LAQAILHSQFARLRNSDRLFFTGDPDLEDEVVTAVIDLDTITLSQIIKRNTGVSKLQDNVFFVVPEPTTWWLTICGILLISSPRSTGPRTYERKMIATLPFTKCVS
jgi:hypothetical protein